MRPVRPGARGPAVEDIQRRLLALGYDLGRTGVDGVFLGLTADAVRSFQSVNGLSEDGVVGDETWSALVDAGFKLGDRMLYLRLPHFHGHDVLALQPGHGQYAAASTANAATATHTRTRVTIQRRSKSSFARCKSHAPSRTSKTCCVSQYHSLGEA